MALRLRGGTGMAVVQQIITDSAVIDVRSPTEDGGLVLVELAPGVTEDEVRDRTEPALLT
ncbi:hypothetical protein BH09ACT12_BH09ACT12_10560 [soil metagenome]